MRRARLVAPVVGALLVAAGASACGGGDSTAGPVPAPSLSPPALWNPCDGLRTAAVEKEFGATLSVETGTPTAPLCRFTPQAQGDAVIDANYSLYGGTIQALLDSFGQASTGRTQVVRVRVPQSEGARLVVTVARGTLLVTGFVKNGDLVQTVNVVDPQPYVRAEVVAATTTLLDDLARHADESGLTGS